MITVCKCFLYYQCCAWDLVSLDLNVNYLYSLDHVHGLRDAYLSGVGHTTNVCSETFGDQEMEAIGVSMSGVDKVVDGDRM
jgi:hypothetical protein